MKCKLFITEDGGEARAEVQLEHGDCPGRIGIQLASATRIISQALSKSLGLKGAHHEEQIEAAIVESYNNDIRAGSLGERAEEG